ADRDRFPSNCIFLQHVVLRGKNCCFLVLDTNPRRRAPLSFSPSQSAENGGPPRAIPQCRPPMLPRLKAADVPTCCAANGTYLNQTYASTSVGKECALSQYAAKKRARRSTGPFKE